MVGVANLVTSHLRLLFSAQGLGQGILDPPMQQQDDCECGSVCKLQTHILHVSVLKI